MEVAVHMYNGLLLILLSLILAAVGWPRARRGEMPRPWQRAVQGVAHLSLAVQVLLGIGLLVRGARITPIHPLLGILALLTLLLPVAVPALKANRPLAAAVVPTCVTVLALLAYGIGEMGVR